MRRGVTDLSGPAARLHPESNLWVPDRRGFERTDRADSISALCDMHGVRIWPVSRLPARRGRAKVHKSAARMFSRSCNKPRQ